MDCKIEYQLITNLRKKKKYVLYIVTNFSVVNLAATYYGKTKHHVCVPEHMAVSALTGKIIKSTKSSVEQDHMLVSDNIVSF